MVSESEFDKNQATFRASQTQATTQDTGQFNSTSINAQAPEGMEWSDDLAQWVPIGTAGQGVVEENPFMTYNPIGFGGGIAMTVEKGAAKAGAKAAAGAIDRNMIDSAASAVYHAIKNAGYSAAKAKSGSSQLAMILKTYRNQFGSMATEEILKKSVDRATFLGLMRAGMESSPAGRIAAKTATSFATTAVPVTMASLASKTAVFSEMLKKIGTGKAAGVITSAITIPMGILLYDFWKGNLNVDEARAQTATLFYKNGRITKAQFDENIRGLGYAPEIEDAYIATGDDQKRAVDVNVQTGEVLGIERLPSEIDDDTAYASRVETQIKAMMADEKKQQQAQIDYETKPVNASGNTQAQIDQINTEFGTDTSREVKRQQEESTPDVLSGPGRNVVQGNELGFASSAGTPTTPAQKTTTTPGLPTKATPTTPGSAPKTKTASKPTPQEISQGMSMLGGYTPASGTSSAGLLSRAQLQAQLGMSLTEEAWQLYRRTGRLP